MVGVRVLLIRFYSTVHFLDRYVSSSNVLLQFPPWVGGFSCLFYPILVADFVSLFFNGCQGHNSLGISLPTADTIGV
jgi:hypothetical protein